MKAKQTGFTLIELMMVIAILGVLAGVGYPSYNKHVQKAHRADALITLVSMATTMEQWRIENNNKYDGVNNAADIGFKDSEDYHFEIAVPDPELSSSSTTSFLLHAQLITPDEDNECYTLYLNSQGKKTAKKIDGSDVEGCWE